MDIDVFSTQDLPTVFRVLRTALRPAGGLEACERLFLDTFARITGYAIPASDPPSIQPRMVRIEGTHRRKRLIQLTAVAVLLHNPVREEAVEFLKDLSRQLEVEEAVIAVIDALSQGRRGRARILTAYRAFPAMLKEIRRAEGRRGVLRFFAALLFKLPVNHDKLWNYKRLGLLPEGTLGREYWKHMTQVGFGFPGEPGGIADSVAYHDIGHVLAGHAATPQGEILQACFQGGNRRDDGFFFIQFAILQFHHGIRITPVAPPDAGHFDPEKVLWAIHRGARCKVDMTHQWNYWPLMNLPIDEARVRCGLLPKLPSNESTLKQPVTRPAVQAERNLRLNFN